MPLPMSKIKSLQLNNFKFFRDSKPLILDGKHLLLYGENGSGKSSVFWGLYTLLEAAYKQPTEVKSYFDSSDTSLVNIFANKQTDPATGIEHYDSYITIETDNGKTFTASLLDTSICGNNDAKESRKATDFLNYQSLFAFQHFKNSEEVDLSDVFDYYILPYVTFPPMRINGKNLSNAAEMWKEYQNGPTKVREYIRKNNKDEFQRFESQFNSEFQKLIDFINQNSYDIIKELGYDIHFKLSYTSPSNHIGYKKYDCQKYKIILTIDGYNGKSIPINRPQTFLNEAKLTALALSIRLCVMKYRTNTLASDALQVLVLDDIMISLDMSNRNKLINLILNDLINQYQIIFLTHNRQLFDCMNSRIIKSDWTILEMYEHNEKPVIQQHKTPLAKAYQYYRGAGCDIDYNACGNNLRQELERILKGLLSFSSLRQKNGKPLDINKLMLKDCIDYAKAKFSSWGFNVCLLNEIDNLRVLTINPTSHFNPKSDYYKQELQRTFEIVEELNNCQIKTFIFANSVLVLKIHDKTSVEHYYKFKLSDDVFIYNSGSGFHLNNKEKYHMVVFENDGKSINYDIKESFESFMQKMCEYNNWDMKGEIYDYYFCIDGKQLSQLFTEKGIHYTLKE